MENSQELFLPVSYSHPPILITEHWILITELSTNAIQAPVAAQEDLSVADGRGRKGLFAQFIARHSHEFRSGAHDIHHSVIVKKINQPLRRDERGVMFAEPL